ncbi:hypothetical protein NEDG_01216 [Nematocida displodere]|uniref:Disintegrin and metalloproteinase domain-containing protein B n=1 Tax=Nematocida displodere TaxID=1805483 RepID=A0A177EAW1_9MICR|nr:hypothetical protein NEDG_01216 [Nematocida displodere]
MGAVLSYYIDEQYVESAVDVTLCEDKGMRTFLSFTLDGVEYSAVIEREIEQRFSLESYVTLTSVYSKKHQYLGRSARVERADIIQQLKGWFLREVSTGLLSGVIIDGDTVIHIKPKRLINPRCRRNDLIAFKAANPTANMECSILLDPDTTKAPAVETQEMASPDLTEDILEVEYLDAMKDYFGNRPEPLPAPELPLMQRLKTGIPSLLNQLFFWWRPISVSQAPLPFGDIPEETTKEASQRLRREIKQVELSQALSRTHPSKQAKCTSCNARSLGFGSRPAPKPAPVPVPGTSTDTPEHTDTSTDTPEHMTIYEFLTRTLPLGQSTLKPSPNPSPSNEVLAEQGPSKRGRARKAYVKPKLVPREPDTIQKGDGSFLGIPFFSKVKEISRSGRRNSTAPEHPVEKKAIPIAVALDSSFISKNGSVKSAMMFALETVNLASKIYEKAFNTQIYVTDVIIDRESRWFNSTGDLSRKLLQFTDYIKHKNKKCLIYHLFTGNKVNQKVGLAWVDVVGNNSKRNASASVLYQNQFITLAHEMAHNFGLVHDCDEASCKEASPTNYPCHPCHGCDCQGAYIMSRKSKQTLLSFSPSSHREMTAALLYLSTDLPRAEDVIMPYAVCGNGIAEKGEECDAGPFGDKCCTPLCKLRPGAECSDANNKCCKDCKILPRGTLCRGALNECQYDAICDGVSAQCPAQQFLPNRKKCASGFCAGGVCTSKDVQCVMAGDRAGIVSATPSHNGCQMSCVNLDGQSVLLKGKYFTNGTPCGWRGVCTKGYCEKDLRVAAMSFLVFLIGVFLLLSLVVG